jgi:hypothetical protein
VLKSATKETSIPLGSFHPIAYRSHPNPHLFFATYAQNSSLEQYDCGKGAGGQEDVSASIKPHDDPAPILHASEHILDPVPLFVEGGVVRYLHLSIFL